jgi:hypothetical protein
MIDFKKIKTVCDGESRISDSFVDQFLLYFIAKNEGLERKIFAKFNDFRNIISVMPAKWTQMLVSQLVIHRTFKKDGVAAKYVNHPQMRGRSPEEREYFKFQVDNPWRFCYCTIQEYLLHDIYRMKDAVSGESFLLYSPGISRMNTDTGLATQLWFLLIGFNGECWQAYGPLAYLKGIQPFDLFFFGRQIMPDILSLHDVQDVIEADPVPFAMLFSGAELPVTFHKKDMIVFHKSEFHIDDIDFTKYEREFLINKKHPITMLSLKRWHTFPHYAKCFFHAKKHLFVVTALTTRGYDSIISALNNEGNEFPLTPDIRATPAMLHCVKNVLHTEIEMNPYEKHFMKPTHPEHQKILDTINLFLKHLHDRLNNHKDYTIAELAALAGIDEENAERIAESVLKKMADDSWKKGSKRK